MTERQCSIRVTGQSARERRERILRNCRRPVKYLFIGDPMKMDPKMQYMCAEHAYRLMLSKSALPGWVHATINVRNPQDWADYGAEMSMNPDRLPSPFGRPGGKS